MPFAAVGLGEFATEADAAAAIEASRKPAKSPKKEPPAPPADDQEGGAS